MPNPHVLILGESGTGKTYSISCLTAELAQEGGVSMVFDSGQGFSPSTWAGPDNRRRLFFDQRTLKNGRVLDCVHIPTTVQRGDLRSRVSLLE
jgi:hypothetical protein